MPEYRIKWALHRDTGTPGRFEVGFKNLTEAETHTVLECLMTLQQARDPTVTGMTTDEIADALGVKL